jgi:hypothetical protein
VGNWHEADGSAYRYGRKKNWDTSEWLSSAYGNIDDNGDLPAFEERPFYKIPDDLLEKGKEILAVLELVEFRWTIKDVLEQPEPELWAVMELKKMGNKYYRQALKRQREPESGETI